MNIEQELKELKNKVETIENGYFGTSPLTHPLTVDNLQQQINIPYTTTLPNYNPRFNGTRTIYFDGTNYYLYIWANGAWRVQTIGASSSSINGRSHGGTNTLLSSGVSGRKVDLATNDYANGITWDSTGFGFVCATAGYYQVNGMILFTTGVVAGDQLVCNINVNGGTEASNIVLHTSAGQNSLNINDIVHLSAGDEVYLYYGGDCSGNDVNYDPSSQYTFLSIAKI